MRNKFFTRLACAWLKAAFMSALLVHGAASAAAQIKVINGDPPGIGFNDTTPVAPVGGNAGATLGEQRLNVFKAVAKFWGDRLQSDIPISVLSFFQPLPCDDTSGVLGSAGPLTVWSDFEGAAKPETWYASALANKLAKRDLLPDTEFDGSDKDILAFFNGDLGKPGCVSGTNFYLGLDGNSGKSINLLATVLHEVGHGLGFATYTDEVTGEEYGSPDQPQPSIWDYNLFDNRQFKTWADMTSEQRRLSAVTPRNLVWLGRHVTDDAPNVLKRGTPELYLFGPGLNDFVFIGTALFGPPITSNALAAPIAQVVDQPDGRGFACSPLDLRNAKKVRGKVALVDRGGGCTFPAKVKNAQLAGARAVIVADNVPGTPPPDMTGTDATINIPSVRVSLEDSARIKTSAAGTSLPFFPIGVMFQNEFKLAGADYLGRVFLYTPNPVNPGSSVSHFDTLATPNLLMEPFLNANQPTAVSTPKDLTLELLKDIGW